MNLMNQTSRKIQKKTKAKIRDLNQKMANLERDRNKVRNRDKEKDKARVLAKEDRKVVVNPAEKWAEARVANPEDLNQVAVCLLPVKCKKCCLRCKTCSIKLKSKVVHREL